MNLINMDDNSEVRFCCGVCNNIFKQRQTLYRHMRQIHKSEPCITSARNIVCPEPECQTKFSYRNQLRKHIVDVHNVALEHEEVSFPTYEDFMLWKQRIEKEMKCLYIIRQSAKNLVSGRKVNYFICHRSGFYSPVIPRKRKSAGSKKICGHCPSSMDVLSKGDEVKVTFWKTHFGHECGIEHLVLTNEEKSLIADKIRKGMTFQHILDDVKDSVNGADLERIHLLNRKDLHNIVKSYNLVRHEIPSPDDSVDVNFSENEITPSLPTSKKVVLKQKLNQIGKILDGELKEEESKYIEDTLDNIISFFSLSRAQSYKSIKRKKARSQHPHKKVVQEHFYSYNKPSSSKEFKLPNKVDETCKSLLSVNGDKLR